MVSMATAMSSAQDRAVLHVHLADQPACQQVLELASQAWRDLSSETPATRALKWFAHLERLPEPAGAQLRRQSNLERVERIAALQEELDRTPADQRFCLSCAALATWAVNLRHWGCSVCQPPPPVFRLKIAPEKPREPAPDLAVLQERLEEVGYKPRRLELLALLAALHRGGPRVFLLEGQPGTGKTFLAESWARVLRTPCQYLLCHSWLSAEDLQTSISVSAAVRGEADAVDQPGFLCEVARLSQQTPVVVVLDEVDKVPERVENLLLDFLQSGRVPGPKGLERANPDNLWVFLTSNGVRPLGHALLRRCCRLNLEPLAEGVELGLVTTQVPQLNPRLAGKLVRLARELREGGFSSPSLFELIRCACDLHTLVRRLKGQLSDEDLLGLLRSWLGKEPEEEEIVRTAARDLLQVIDALP